MNDSRLTDFAGNTAPGDSSLMTAALWKIALLTLTGISCHYSLTPPHVAEAKTVVVNKAFFERAIQWFTFCSKTMVWMMTMSDAVVTYLTAFHHAPSSFACPHRPTQHASYYPLPTQPANALLIVSPLLVLGAASVIFANILRQWCFRQLGPLFTFEITIQSNHKLVTTGPYAVVRHPSYIGVYLTLLGSTAVGFAPGSWLRECWFSFACTGMPVREGAGRFALGLPSIGQVVVFLLLAFWFAKLSIVFKSTYKRLNIEDQALHKVFGKSWEEYARRVRWRILPGIC